MLTARNALGIDTTATLSVIVDRTLIGLSVEPRVFSPNGDGRARHGDVPVPAVRPGPGVADRAPRHADDRAGLHGPAGAGPADDRVERPLPTRWSASGSTGPRCARPRLSRPLARPCPSQSTGRGPRLRLPGAFAADARGQRAGRRDRRLRREPHGHAAGAWRRAASGSRPAALSRRSARWPAISPGTTAGRSLPVAARRSTGRSGAPGDEQLDEQLGAVDLGAGLDEQRRGASPPGARLGCTLTLIPMPSTTRRPLASARMPAALRPSSRMSFGSLIVGSSPVTAEIASAHGLAGDERELRPAARLDGRLEQDRAEHARRRAARPSCLPRRPRPSVCSSVDGDRALGVLRAEQPLGRSADLGIDIRPAEPAAQAWNHELRSERPGHARLH